MMPSDLTSFTRNPWNLDHTPGGSSGGSVRYPAALTGLVGVKPQRDRLPLGPEHASGWHGMVSLGPVTRSVRDAALFLDLASNSSHSAEFRDALGGTDGSITVAVSTNSPAGSQVSLSANRRKSVDDAALFLATLGCNVIEADIDYGLASIWNSTVRFLKGVQDDVASLPNRKLLERRTRTVARPGRAIPTRTLEKAVARQEERSNAIGAIFTTADVVMTPLCESPAPLVAECPKRGARRSLRAANTSAWLIPWNLTGQPALSVPIGVDERGLPTAIHLVAWAGEEATLLALAAAIERHRPFPKLDR